MSQRDTLNDEALEVAEDLIAAKTADCEPLYDSAAAHILRLVAENEKFRTVMVAAAEEIHEHWDAHCDSEGYGPANLMHRLENGIPSQYGYTAGAFAKLKAENEDLLRTLRLRGLEISQAMNTVEAQAALLRQAVLEMAGLRNELSCLAGGRIEETETEYTIRQHLEGKA